MKWESNHHRPVLCSTLTAKRTLPRAGPSALKSDASGKVAEESREGKYNGAAMSKMKTHPLTQPLTHRLTQKQLSLTCCLCRTVDCPSLGRFT